MSFDCLFFRLDTKEPKGQDWKIFDWNLFHFAAENETPSTNRSFVEVKQHFPLYASFHKFLFVEYFQVVSLLMFSQSVILSVAASPIRGRWRRSCG